MNRSRARRCRRDWICLSDANRLRTESAQRRHVSAVRSRAPIGKRASASPIHVVENNWCRPPRCVNASTRKIVPRTVSDGSVRRQADRINRYLEKLRGGCTMVDSVVTVDQVEFGPLMGIRRRTPSRGVGTDELSGGGATLEVRGRRGPVWITSSIPNGVGGRGGEGGNIH